MKFSFVILNFNTYSDTIECVNSIYKYTNPNLVKFNIVIVDNGSTNDSYDVLYNKYYNVKEVKLIKSDYNLGFSKGNNLGFKYAKNKFKPDFIIMCNSDTEILNKKIYSEIIKSYDKYDFAVLGPKEKLSNDFYYPLNMVMYNYDSIMLKIKQFKKDLFFIKFHLEWLDSFICKIYKNFHYYENNKILDNNKLHRNIVLHGAFLVFSRNYIIKFDGLDDRTFLYCEEYFLYKRLIDNNLISVYNPKIEIFHKKESSTNSVTKDIRAKKINRLNNELKSLMILRDDLKKSD